MSIATNRAAVLFDPAKVRVADIKLAVAKAGYTPLQVETKRDVEAEKKRTAKRTDSIRRRFLLAVVFAAPLLYISMGHMVGLPLPPFLNPMHHAFAFALCQLILTLPILYAGRSFYSKGIKAVLHGSPNMDTLVAIGSAAAFLYSVYSVVRTPFTSCILNLPGLLSPSFCLAGCSNPAASQKLPRRSTA
mgnify:CR=1 FL=1